MSSIHNNISLHKTTR